LHLKHDTRDRNDKVAKFFFQVKASTDPEGKRKLRPMVNGRAWKLDKNIGKDLKECMKQKYGLLPTVENAVGRVRLGNRKEVLLQGDVEFMFGNIRRKVVDKWLKKFLPEHRKAVMKSLSLKMITPLGIMSADEGLPIGHPWSPWLAHGVTKEFADKPAKEQMLKKKIDIDVARYVDDLGARVPKQNKKEAEHIITKAYRKIGLEIEWDARKYLGSESKTDESDCGCQRMGEKTPVNYVCTCMATYYTGRIKAWASHDIPVRTRHFSFIDMCRRIIGLSIPARAIRTRQQVGGWLFETATDQAALRFDTRTKIGLGPIEQFGVGCMNLHDLCYLLTHPIPVAYMRVPGGQVWMSAVERVREAGIAYAYMSNERMVKEIKEHLSGKFQYALNGHTSGGIQKINEIGEVTGRAQHDSELRPKYIVKWYASMNVNPWKRILQKIRKTVSGHNATLWWDSDEIELTKHCSGCNWYAGLTRSLSRKRSRGRKEKVDAQTDNLPLRPILPQGDASADGGPDDMLWLGDYL